MTILCPKQQQMLDNTMVLWYSYSMNDYTVTNIRLPKQELINYRELALSMGISFSELVRKVLARFSYPPAITKVSKTKVSFWEIEKVAVKGGSKTASIDHDKYIY